MKKRFIIAVIYSLLISSILGASAMSLKETMPQDNLNDFNDPFFKTESQHFEALYKQIHNVQKEVDKTINAQINTMRQNSHSTKNFSTILKNDTDKSQYIVEVKMPKGFDEKNVKTDIKENTIRISANWDNLVQSKSTYKGSTGNFYRYYRVEQKLDPKDVKRKASQDELIITIPYKHKDL